MSLHIRLDDVAGILGVHKRTVRRRMEGRATIRYNAQNCAECTIGSILRAYRMDLGTLEKALAGLIELLTAPQAIGYLSSIEGRRIPRRTFQHRKYPTAVNGGMVRRYTYEQLKEHQEKLVVRSI